MFIAVLAEERAHRPDDPGPVDVREEDHVPGRRGLDVEVVHLHHAFVIRLPRIEPATLTGPSSVSARSEIRLT